MAEINLTSNFSHMLDYKRCPNSNSKYYVDYGVTDAITDIQHPTEAEMEIIYEATKDINKILIGLIDNGGNLNFRKSLGSGAVGIASAVYGIDLLPSGHEISSFTDADRDIAYFYEGNHLYLGIQAGGN